jgi:hypothetical protein
MIMTNGANCHCALSLAKILICVFRFLDILKLN